MIDDEMRALLERGCAIIIGTADPDGRPHAQRGWGCSVVDPTTVRLLLDSTDELLRTHLADPGRIAVTAADVRTLDSVQIKGRVLVVEEPTEADLARCEAHNEELFADIAATDFYPREFTERMVPPGWVVAVVQVEEAFDQTPGPGAGAPVPTPTR